MGKATGTLRRTPRELGYRERQVLDYIRAVIGMEGMAPSYGMICDSVGIDGRGNVCRIVKGLEGRGLLRRVGAGRVRRLRLTD